MKNLYQKSNKEKNFILNYLFSLLSCSKEEIVLKSSNVVVGKIFVSLNDAHNRKETVSIINIILSNING
jgi:hypothetical protein